LAFPHRPDFQILWQSQGWLWAYAYNFEIFRVNSWFSMLNHCWSLAVEEQFYLVWPAVVALLAPRRLVVATAILGLGSVLLRVWMGHRGFSNIQIYVFTPARCDGLMFGAAIAALEHLGTSRRAMARLALSGVALGCVVRGITALRTVGAGNPLDLWIATGWTPIFAALVAATTLDPQGGAIGRALGWAPLRFLGKYSYGIYLFHQPLFVLAEGRIARVVLPFSGAATNAMRLALVGSVTIALAFVSYNLFEVRFLRLQDRFRG
jgi:peptidoglycan/LPS O-acetylase OafA/YrhL